MEVYCKEDTALLEEVYLELRPWIKSHPNLAVIMEAEAPCCPNCGSFEFEEGEGYYTTPQNKYVTIRCKDCGAVNRKKVSELSAKCKNNLLVPTAR
jgi:RNase P subunit RPR2